MISKLDVFYAAISTDFSTAPVEIVSKRLQMKNSKFKTKKFQIQNSRWAAFVES